jgi:hypothetical protein
MSPLDGSISVGCNIFQKDGSNIIRGVTPLGLDVGIGCIGGGDDTSLPSICNIDLAGFLLGTVAIR